MDEAKTLIHMSVSAMMSAMFLVAALAFIGTGYMIWNYFSRQDAANQRMSDYVNYTAFDNTTVRGQEVIELLESDLDIFVVFLDGTSKTATKSINDMTTGNPTFIYYTETTGVKDFKFNTIQSTDNAITTCTNALSKIKSKNSTPESILSASKCLNGKSHSELIKVFTDSVSGLGAKAKTASTQTNSYAAFKSVLVYAEDGTTDVVGVILVRADANVEVF